MSTLDSLSLTTVPPEHQVFVDRLRRYLRDKPEFNTLLDKQENEDIYLYSAIQDAFDELNYEIEPVFITFNNFLDIPWNLLQTGAILAILVGQGITSARNQVSYQDSGNLSVAQDDVYGRYVNWYNVLINKYMRAAQAFKRAKNIDNAYGGISSEYSNLGYSD